MKASTSALLLSALSAGVLAQNYDTYPSVAKTASINGFADPIYDQLPECAKECVEYDTDNTPCPNWDPGCLCYMPQWSGEVASCFAEKCSGDELKSATSLAYGICDKVGASKWEMPSSVSKALSSAAEAKATATSSAEEEEADSSSAAPASSAPTSSAAQSTSAAETSEQTSAAGSSTPAVTSSTLATSSSTEASSSAVESSASSAAGSSSAASTSANSTSIDQVNGGVGPASYGMVALGAVAGAIVLA